MADHEKLEVDQCHKDEVVGLIVPERTGLKTTELEIGEQTKKLEEPFCSIYDDFCEFFLPISDL